MVGLVWGKYLCGLLMDEMIRIDYQAAKVPLPWR